MDEMGDNEIYFKEYRISDVLAAVKRYSLDSDEAFFLIWDPATVDDKKVQRKQRLYYNCKTTLQRIVAVAEV